MKIALDFIINHKSIFFFSFSFYGLICLLHCNSMRNDKWWKWMFCRNLRYLRFFFVFYMCSGQIWWYFVGPKMWFELSTNFELWTSWILVRRNFIGFRWTPPYTYRHIVLIFFFILSIILLSFIITFSPRTWLLYWKMFYVKI